MCNFSIYILWIIIQFTIKMKNNLYLYIWSPFFPPYFLRILKFVEIHKNVFEHIPNPFGSNCFMLALLLLINKYFSELYTMLN